MKLTSDHRETFLIALGKAEEEERINYACVMDHGQDFEAYHFLALQRIETIKKALIDNEIDY